MRPYDSDRLTAIAIALSAEKRLGALLDLILSEAMSLTHCDAGTVYIREGEVLRFGNMVTLSKGIRVTVSDEGGDVLPPVPLDRHHVCACVALDKRIINIPDVYSAADFDFSGPRRYDALNAYRTCSMLVVPMEDERGRCIGVLQLINAMDDEGALIPFDAGYEKIVSALTSLAAVSLNNSRLSKAVYDILHSFVTVMVDAVDARSPYNANHTRSMVRCAERFLAWLDETGSPLRFAEEEKDPFLMSVWLHDIGKLVIPLEIMDKPTRLGSAGERVLSRLCIAELSERLRAATRPEEAEEALRESERLRETAALIRRANAAPFLDDDTLAALRALAGQDCLTADGARVPLLSPDELESLCVRRGTLTTDERKEIENHVVYTARLLGQMRFGSDYASVPLWAGAHHEFLNGSGYPEHLSAAQLPREVRLLTILDIYDALTAEDRPYKPPMPPERAFSVLESMRDEGKLDGELLALFKRSGAWKKD